MLNEHNDLRKMLPNRENRFYGSLKEDYRMFHQKNNILCHWKISFNFYAFWQRAFVVFFVFNPVRWDIYDLSVRLSVFAYVNYPRVRSGCQKYLNNGSSLLPSVILKFEKNVENRQTQETIHRKSCLKCSWNYTVSSWTKKKICSNLIQNQTIGTDQMKWKKNSGRISDIVRRSYSQYLCDHQYNSKRRERNEMRETTRFNKHTRYTSIVGRIHLKT